MKEILYFLLERGNSPLATEVVLLVIVWMLAPRLVDIASQALDDNLPFRRIAGYVNQVLRLGLPIAILLWVLSIALRYL